MCVNIAVFFLVLLPETSSPDLARDSGEVFDEVLRRTWDRELSLALQESGVGVDELVSLSVVSQDRWSGANCSSRTWTSRTETPGILAVVWVV